MPGGLLCSLALAHVDLTVPPPRTTGGAIEKVPGAKAGTCSDGTCFWFSQGCQPGCTNCTDGFALDGNCKTEMEPTVTDSAFRTYMDDPSYGDYTKHNPWRSPGYAPVFSPCGLAGGGMTNHPRNGATAHMTGQAQGFDGRHPLPYAVPPPTVWKRGHEAEVAWSITANHGGGYAYRLCPKASSWPEEACFQAHHLSLKGNTSWIVYGAFADSPGARHPIRALRTTTGTHPAGAQWTRNPIPACKGSSGGVGKGFNCSGAPPQFEPPLPGLYGYGHAECFEALGGKCTHEQAKVLRAAFNFNIVDKLDVPSWLKAGEYVLSFRYDAEQTPQVWANCADVEVVEGEE